MRSNFLLILDYHPILMCDLTLFKGDGNEVEVPMQVAIDNAIPR